MKHLIITAALALSVGVIGCDNQGITEPVAVSAPGVTSFAKHEGGNAGGGVTAVQTIVINHFLNENQETTDMYIVSGQIDYTMTPLATEGPDPGKTQSYRFSGAVNGSISSELIDEALWSFQDAESFTVSIGDGPSTFVLSCPLSGRDDKAALNLQIRADASGLGLADVWIDVPLQDGE